MVQSDQTGPVRPSFKQRLIPDFRLRPGVGEHQAAGAGVEFGDYLRQHLQTDVSGPGKAFDGRWEEGVDLEGFFTLALNADATALWDQHLLGVGLITERGGDAPDDQVWLPIAQAGEGQLQLHAAFIAEQFVPFVHDDHAQGRQCAVCVGAGE